MLDDYLRILLLYFYYRYFGCLVMAWMQHIKSLLKKDDCLYRKVDSLKAYAGRNRAMLEWQKLLDPRAKTAKIFWENRTRSTELQLTDKAGLTQVIVKDLAEGSYVFEVCTYDTHGNSSIMSEVPCTVYGDVYEKLLFNTKVKTASFKKRCVDHYFCSFA